MSASQQNCTGVDAPKVLSFSTAAISAGFSLITSPGNLLVCLAVFLDPNRELRTSFNFFIVNLALADLTVGLITEPLSFVYHLREGFGLHFSLLQSVHHYLYFTTCTASILSLGALTVERHSAATSAKSYRARQSSSNKRYLWATSGIWLASAVVSGFYFVTGPLIQSLAFTVTAVTVTFIILMFTYLRIYSVLKARTQANLNRSPPKTNEDSLEETRRNTRDAFKAIEYEKKLTKVFAVILVCYICCFIPACVLIFTMNFCSSCSCEAVHWMRDVQFWFVLLNSAVNPYLYAWRIPHFKRAIVSIMRCQRRKRKIYDRTGKQYNQSTNQPDQSISKRDRSVSQRGQSISQRDRSVSQRDQSVSQRDPSVSQCDPSVNQRDPSVNQRDQSISQRDRSVSQYNQSVTSLSTKRDQSITQRDRSVNQRDRSVNQRDQSANQHIGLTTRMNYQPLRHSKSTDVSLV